MPHPSPSRSLRLIPLIAALIAAVPATCVAADSHVVMWGDNMYGQMNIPNGLKDVVQAGGNFRTVYAVHADGTVTSWGVATLESTTAQTAGAPPAGALTGVKKIVSSRDLGVALKTNGTVVAWGGNSITTNVLVRNWANTAANVKDVSLGRVHIAALLTNGTVSMAGDPEVIAGMPAGLSSVSDIATDDAGTVALKTDGTLVGWGDSFLPSAAWKNIPPGLTNVAMVSGTENGWVDGMALLKKDGTVMQFGGGAIVGFKYYRTLSEQSIVSIAGPGGQTQAQTFMLQAQGTRKVLVVRNASGNLVTPVTLTAGADVKYVTSFAANGLVVVNDPPTISSVTDKTIAKDGTLAGITFTVGDHAQETPLANLVVNASSSNVTLFPAGSVVLGGTNPSRTLSLTPAAGLDGTATITLRVTDGGGLTTTSSFVVTVGSGGGGGPSLSHTITDFILEGAIPNGVTSVTANVGSVATAGSTWTLTVPASNSGVTVTFTTASGASSARTFNLVK